jgi:large subunit ribosomal protein L28
MARRCDVTGKGVMSGNNVSHAHNKTRRRFMPNVQKMTIYSETLGSVRLKMAVSTLRSVERSGGLDAYLLGRSVVKLTGEALKLRKRIEKAQGRAAS